MSSEMMPPTSGARHFQRTTRAYTHDTMYVYAYGPQRTAATAIATWARQQGPSQGTQVWRLADLCWRANAPCAY